MASKRTRWLLALVAALALVVAACETDDEEEVTDPDDVEEPVDEPDPEEEEDEVGIDDDAVEEDDGEDPTPADGETVLDALTARAEDVDAPEPGEEDAEDAEEEPVEEDPTFVTLVEAIEIAGLEELLDSEGPFTVFAPTDEAFALYPEDSFEELVADPERLEEVLGYHIAEGEYTSDDLAPDDELDTVTGQTLTVRESEGGDLLIEGAPIVETDIDADNGVVHAIGTVLLAPAE